MRWPSVRKAPALPSRSDSAISEPRRLAIEQIISDVISTRRDGRTVDYAALESTHRDLMPELGERLRRLRAVDIAAEWDDRLRATPPEWEDDSGFREDAEFLGEHLPGYSILEHVHYGGQGVVFRAIQNSTNRAVAIKLLLDGPLATRRQQDRFAREVELVSRIQHPNIVTVHDSGVIRRRPYLVMEYVDGLPIDDYVLLHSVPVGEIVALFRQVCRGVSAAHQNGIIHRDLKPANILVDPEGQPHILDFGLAKDLSDAGVMESLSIPGRVVGTLPYLSPEQASGVGELVDVRSDVYSLGVLLYQLITGGFPYPTSGEPREVLTNIQSRPARPLREALREDCPDWIQDPREIQDDLERIVLKSLEKEKDFRYQSAAALADDLGRYLAGDAVEAKAASRLYLLKKTVRKFRVHFAIAACFVAILIASLIGVTAAWQRTKRIAEISQAGLQMGAFVRLGSVERDAGRIDQGIALFQKAIEIANEVSTDDPFVLRQSYGAHYRLAHLYYEKGESAQGQPHLEAAVRIARDMVARAPDDMDWRRNLAYAVLLQGKTASALQKWEVALEHFAVAEVAFRDFLSANPESPDQRFDLVVLLETMATAGQHVDRFDDTFAWLEEAKEMLEALVDTDASNIDYRLEHARTELKIAVCHLYRRAPDDEHAALRWLDQAEADLAKLEPLAQAAGREWGLQRLRDVALKNRTLAMKRLGNED